MAMAATKRVVLFPFPGQGHLSAFMSIATLLHRALPDAAITLISTPRNVAALQTAADITSTSAFLGFHTLPFTPADHGLPVDCESSDALPGSLLVNLFDAFAALQPAFDHYVEAAVDAAGGVGGDICIVSDPSTAWTATVARWHGCSHAFFVSCGAFCTRSGATSPSAPTWPAASTCRSTPRWPSTARSCPRTCSLETSASTGASGCRKGFEERVRASNRGLLVHGWAPQVRILAHPSTSAFLSHCGWNSVLESLAHGVPIIAWPLAADQFYNAKMLEEDWGVCVEVARGDMEGTVVHRGTIVDTVEMVMGATATAAEMWWRVREIKAVMEASWTEGGEEFSTATKLKGS